MRSGNLVLLCILAYYSLALFYSLLAITRPKAGREVGALNWTQEPKSIWDGPTSKSTGHAPRLARDWPVPKSVIAQSSARGPRGLSQNRPFCTVFQFLHIKGLNFPTIDGRTIAPAILVFRCQRSRRNSSKIWGAKQYLSSADSRQWQKVLTVCYDETC